ncbi:MAG: hypothetical protein HYU73_01275 [Betaproteobacteria bacterium]|nr:hypothetical protein [Betaproteobacteria bacterium]
MERANKLLVGGVGLLLCLAVLARLSSVNTDVQSPDLDALASLYLSAAPYALVTPAGFHVRTAATPFSDEVYDDVPRPAPLKAYRGLLAEYVRLHQTRVERMP